MNLRFFYFILILSVFARAAQPLSLPEALEAVKKNNLEVAVARSEAKLSAYKEKIAKAKKYGSLDLVTSALRSNDAGKVFGFKLESREADFGAFGFSDFLNHSPNPMDSSVLQVQPDDLNYPGARNHFSTKLNYRVPLYTGGKISSYERITRALHRLSRLRGQKVLRQKMHETRKSFYDISLLHSYQKDLRALQKNLGLLHETAEAMYQEGYAKKVDLYEIEAKQARISRLISQARADEALAYDFLSFLLDTKITQIRYTGSRVGVPAGGADAYVQNSTKTQMARQGLVIAKESIKMEKSRFLPQVGAFAQYGSSDNSFLNDFAQKDSYTVGAKLEWNLFSGGADDAQVQMAKIRRAKQNRQLQLAKKAVKLEVSRIKTRVKKIEASLAQLAKQKRFYKQVYDNYRGRYRQQLADINDVIAKHSQLIETVIKIKNEKTRRNKAVFALIKMMQQEQL